MINQSKIRSLIQGHKSLIISVLFKFTAIFIALYVNRWINTRLSNQDIYDINISISLASIIVGSTSLGIYQIIYNHYIKKRSQEENNSMWTTMLVLQMVIFLIIFPASWLVFLFFPTIKVSTFIIFFLLTYVLTLDLNFRSITDVNDKNWQYSLTDLVGKGLLVVMLFSVTLLSLTENQLNLYLAFNLGCCILQLLLDCYFQRRYVGIGPFSWELVKEYRSDIIYIGSMSLIAGLGLNTDKIILGYLQAGNVNMVNGYINMYKFLEISVVLVSITTPNLFAKFANSRELNNINLKSLLFNKWAGVCTFLGVVSSIGFMICGPILLGVIDRDRRFTSYSMEVFPWLALAILPTGISAYLTQFLYYQKKAWIELSSIVVYTIVSLILYFSLIPQYGHIGAAIASVIGNFLVVVVKIVIWQITNRTNLASS
jgi:polysaccharide transporter, PST family